MPYANIKSLMRYSKCQPISAHSDWFLPPRHLGSSYSECCWIIAEIIEIKVSLTMHGNNYFFGALLRALSKVKQSMQAAARKALAKRG